MKNKRILVVLTHWCFQVVCYYTITLLVLTDTYAYIMMYTQTGESECDSKNENSLFSENSRNRKQVNIQETEEAQTLFHLSLYIPEI